MAPCFNATRRAWRVRALQWLGIACAGGCLYWGVDLAFTYGLRPADGGVLAPLAIRLAWAGFLALIGTVIAGGLLFYGRCYVLTLMIDPQSGDVEVSTIRLFGSSRQRYPAESIQWVRSHSGRFRAGDLSVKAPWTGIRLKGRRWSYILDGQGDFLDTTLMNTISKVRKNSPL